MVGVNKKQRVAELSLLGVCVFWGASFVAVKDALSRSSPMVFTALRFALAAAFMLLLYRRGLRQEHAAGGVLCGALLFLGYSFQTAGLQLTTASRSAFLTALSIPLCPFCQCLLFWRRPRLHDLVGATLACAGTFLLTRPSGGDSEGQTAPFNNGDLLTVLCALAFALHIVALNHFSSEEVGPDAFQTVSVVQLAVVALFSGLLCDVAEHAVLRPTAKYWAEMAVVALLATAVAFTVFSWAQKHTTATRTAIICSSEAMFAAITSYLMCGEVMSAVNIGGAALIVVGILAGEINELKLNTALRRLLEPHGRDAPMDPMEEPPDDVARKADMISLVVM